MNNSNTIEYFGRDLEAMSFAVNYHRWIIDEIRSFIKSPIIEVGAGSGNFSDELYNVFKELPLFKLFAFEPSANMYALLKNRFKNVDNIETFNDYFYLEIDLSENINTILYINVLEHIEMDKEELISAYKKLNTGGRVIVFVPALQFLFSSLDKQLGHYRRYHKKQLVTLLKVAGFQVEKVKYFDLVGILPWYITFTLMGKIIQPGNVKFYDKLVVPIMSRIEKKFAPPIGKNLLIIGKK